MEAATRVPFPASRAKLLPPQQPLAKAHAQMRRALRDALLGHAPVAALGEPAPRLGGDTLGDPSLVAGLGHHDVPHAPIHLQGAAIALLVAQAPAGVAHALEALVVEEAPDAARGVELPRPSSGREVRQRLLKLRRDVGLQHVLEDLAVPACAGDKVRHFPSTSPVGLVAGVVEMITLAQTSEGR